MSLEAAFTLGTLVLVTALLALEVLSADLLLLGALAVLVVGGVIDLDTALHGFANTTLVAIGGLYVVAAGLRDTGALDRAGHLLLGAARSLRHVLLRLSLAVAAGSAFLNNTPIVAMGVPAVRRWARREGRSVSRLLMPLSFASIFGGLCTLIGTSTNLVADGLLRSHGLERLGFFELAWVGVPCAALGIVYLVLVAPRLLEEREDVRAAEERERAALLELELEEDSPLVGRSIREAGLRRLPGLRLVRIERGGRGHAPVPAGERLRRGDHLLYAPEGREEVPEEPSLDTYPGLHLALTRAVPGDGEAGRELHEAVVREGSSLIGARVEDVGFLERFGAAVTGIRRGGERLDEPLGRVRLRAGDTLMLDTGPGFRRAYEDVEEFYVATEAEGGDVQTAAGERREAPRGMAAAVAILAAVVLLAVTGVTHIALSALLGAIAMVACGFLSPGEARESVDWAVLIVIGAAFGLASAMEQSGAARFLGDLVVRGSAAFGPMGLLAGVVLSTMLLTGLITNNAAAALMFPIAMSMAASKGVDPRPLVIGLTVAASLSLWTPLGYQTNLMVYGPGNYRFTDFVRVGLPIQLGLAAVAVAVIPLFWSF